MNAIKRAFALFKASRKVLDINRQIALYPLFYIFAFSLVNFVFFLPFTLNLFGLGDYFLNTGTLEGEQPPLVLLPFFILLYGCHSFIYVFFSTACYLAADEALQGKKLSVWLSIKKAWPYRKNIAKWSIFAGIISAILRYLEEKLEIAGKIIVGLLGFAFSIASIFAIPALVQKNSGPLETLRHSGALVKRTWGENAAYGVGISAFSLLVLLLVLILPSFAAALIIIELPAFFYLGITLAATSILLSLWFVFYISALDAIFKAALYRYADTGDYVGPYTPEMIKGAFTVKTKKSLPTR